MRRALFFISLCLVVCGVACAETVNPEPGENTGSTAGGQRALPFSTAVITYESKSAAFNGLDMAYIDAVNNRVRRETGVDTQTVGSYQKSRKLEICDGKITYQINRNKKKKALSFPARNPDAVSSIFYEDMYKPYYQGKGTVLGRSCNVYLKPPGEETYFWNGILLKRVISDHPMGAMFNVITVAVKIELNVPIGEEKFMLPKKARVVDVDDTVTDMEKSLKRMKKVTPSKKKKMVEEVINAMNWSQ